jgi:2'-5' RNA ligase
MAEAVDPLAAAPLASVNILLPEALDRRLQRRTDELPGASWPAWGGHITLVPLFRVRGTLDELRTTLAAVCAAEPPFEVRFGLPLTVQDSTRQGYAALFLAVEGVDVGSLPSVSEQESVPLSPLHTLRANLLEALAPLRDDLYPTLVEQRFHPHVTLALSLAESEANRLVREMRANPIEAQFTVEQVWLVTQSAGESGRVEHEAVVLGRKSAGDLWRD